MTLISDGAMGSGAQPQVTGGYEPWMPLEKRARVRGSVIAPLSDAYGEWAEGVFVPAWRLVVPRARVVPFYT